MAHIAQAGHEEVTAASYCKYIPVKVGKVTCAALVDSGNIWRTAISGDFFRSLGFGPNDLRPIPLKELGTAKKDAALTIEGETAKPLYVSFAGSATKFKIRPIVVTGLSMAMNIGGPFLKLNNIDQLHSRNALRIQGHDVPLLATPTSGMPGPEISSSLVYVAGETVVPAKSVVFVPLRAPEVEGRRMPHGDGVLEGSTKFMKRTDLHPWVGSITRCDEHGHLTGGLMNTLDVDIVVPEGQAYGDFTLTCGVDEATSHPWRISTMEGPEVPADVAAAKPCPNPVTLPKSKAAQRKWACEQFKLQDSPFLKEQVDQDAAADLLLEYLDVFSLDGSFGKTDLLVHEIFTEEIHPIKTRNRPLNPVLEADLKVQVDKWLQHDVIEASQSPWNFALVAAPKKGGAIRWCVDYRRLNEVTLKDTFPLPNINDNLARLSRSRIFSGIDGCAPTTSWASGRITAARPPSPRPGAPTSSRGCPSASPTRLPPTAA